MSEQAASAKVCSKCGQDVSGKPRTKDAQGRYVCAECAKGDAAPAAKTAPKPAAKAASAGDNAFLLDLGGKPLTVNLCPNCQQPMKEGAKLCTLCGFDQAEGKTLRTRISKEKASKDKTTPGFLSSKDGHAFVITVLLVAIPLALGIVQHIPEGIYASMLVSLVAIGWGVRFAAREVSREHGFMLGLAARLFFPYGIYACFFHQYNRMIKAIVAAGTIGLVVSVIVGTMTLASWGEFKDDGAAADQTPAQQAPSRPAPSAPKAPARAPST